MTVAQTKAVRTRCDSCAIRERAVCAYCGPEQLAQLDAIKSYRTYPKGATILAAGERSPFVASIVHGVVTLSKTLIDGRMQIVGLQFPADFVGAALRRQAAFDAVAATEVMLCQFERNAFEHLMKTTPQLRVRLIDLMMDELETAREWMALLGQKTAREKVASFLMMIARRNQPGPDGAIVADLPLTRSEIGRHLGLTIETISRQMSSLRGSGVIEFENQRRFRVPEPARLTAEAGDG